MSINKNANKLRPILIGNGFPASGKHPKYYPKDRLTKFLNLNPSDADAVDDYCKNYIFLPRDISKGFLKGFQREYKEIKDFSVRATNKLLTEKDERKLNRILRNIHTEIRIVTGKEKSAMNLDLGGIPINKRLEKQIYYDNVKKHSGTIVSLWEDLLKHIIENQDVKQCIRCGNFFEISSRSHGKKFCGPTCQNSYNHKKRYKEKLKKTNI